MRLCLILAGGLMVAVLTGCGSSNPAASPTSAPRTVTASPKATSTVTVTPAPRPTVTVTVPVPVPVPVPGPTRYVPVPVPSVYTPPPYYNPITSSVWGWYGPALPIPAGIRIHVHTSPDLNTPNVAEITAYDGGRVGVVCAINGGPTINTYTGTTSRWDYVNFAGITGWVSDGFLNTPGPAIPNC